MAWWFASLGVEGEEDDVDDHVELGKEERPLDEKET